MIKFHKYDIDEIICFFICIFVVFVMGFAVGYMERDPVVETPSPIVINIHPTTDTKTPEVEVIPEEQEKETTRTYSVTPPENLSPIDKVEYDDKKYKFTPVKTKETDELRAEVYEVDESLSPIIWTHEGGSYVDELELYQTVHAVIWNQPNLPHTDEMVNLVYETLMVESNLGQVSYDYAARNWHNYGMAQIREDTAEYLIVWLHKVRRDAAFTLLQYYDTNLSLKDNLLTNVPFSIAVASQYYWHRIPDIQANITTPEDRAKVWKSVYNGPGAGTVNIYLNRVKQHYAKIDTSKTLLVYVDEDSTSALLNL